MATLVERDVCLRWSCWRLNLVAVPTAKSFRSRAGGGGLWAAGLQIGAVCPRNTPATLALGKGSLLPKLGPLLCLAYLVEIGYIVPPP